MVFSTLLVMCAFLFWIFLMPTTSELEGRVRDFVEEPLLLWGLLLFDRKKLLLSWTSAFGLEEFCLM